MEFGLGLMGYHGCWDDAAFAEQHGFSTMGFVDTPLIGGDPFVSLGLAAAATTTARVGTFLAIPGLRPAPTTASAIASVNRIAPGRVFLGTGTGYTGRQTFGLGPVPVARLRDYARECRALLDGEEVLHRSGKAAPRPIRFDHFEDLYTDREHRIPIYVGADGPKALAAAGQAGADGLVMTMKYSHVMQNAADVFTASFASVQETARNEGHDMSGAYTMASLVACVLEPGESPTSPRALEFVGAAAMMAFHTYACNPAIADYLPAPIRDRIEVYEREVIGRFGLPRERAYQKAHSGHLARMIEGEAAVLTDDIVRMTTLTGEAHEIAAQLRALEAAGLRNVTFWAPPHLTREFVVSFEEQVMPLMAAAPA